MLRTYLYGASGDGWVAGQAIQHAIIRQIAIPRDFTFLGRKPLPSKSARQRLQAFLRPAVDRTLVGGLMDLAVALLTPCARLGVEVGEIGKTHARPEAVLDNADAALDFALGLGGIRPTDPW